MRFLYALCLFAAAVSVAAAEEISVQWQHLNSRYLEFVTAEKYEDALTVALELNS